MKSSVKNPARGQRIRKERTCDRYVVGEDIVHGQQVVFHATDAKGLLWSVVLDSPKVVQQWSDGYWQWHVSGVCDRGQVWRALVVENAHGDLVVRELNKLSTSDVLPWRAALEAKFAGVDISGVLAAYDSLDPLSKRAITPRKLEGIIRSLVEAGRL